MGPDSGLVSGIDEPDIVLVAFIGGWKRFRCSCYYRSEEKRNWTESQRLCKDLGGGLVSIGNREEDVSP